MKLSIIVPVYNAAPYLSQFLKSVSCAAAQVADSEVIFVDDCSTDDSLAILSDMAARCGSFIVHHLPRNQGVSCARQAGLDMAKGEYIIFADPDDWMDEGMYADLVRVADECGSDLITEDYFNGERREDQFFEGDSEAFVHELIGSTGRIHGATWNKLIRRSFVEKSGARFCEERLGFCEDVDFLCQILSAKPIIKYVNACHYHYRVVATSATHRICKSTFDDLALVARRLERVFDTLALKKSLLNWRRHHRLAAFLCHGLDYDYVRTYESAAGDIWGSGVRWWWQVIFWAGIRCRFVRELVFLCRGLR